VCSDSKEVDGFAEQDQRVLVCGGCVSVCICESVYTIIKIRIKNGNTIAGNKLLLLYNTQ